MIEEQLLRAIAEMEGYEVVEYHPDQGVWIKGPGEGFVENRWFNPRTNWSDCGPLIEKYNVQLGQPLREPEWQAWLMDVGGHNMPYVSHADLKHAIVEAIVRSNENA